VNVRVYRDIYSMLNTKEDIPVVRRQFNYPEETLYSILGQKIVRRTKKDFYVIKRQSHYLLRDWKRGKSLLEISREKHFSPVLLGTFILTEYGLTRREIRDFLANPSSIRDERMKREVDEILEEDIVYSPTAYEIQRRNGKNAEDAITQWLLERNIRFTHELERRNIHTKTPDFLFEKFVVIGTVRIRWIESKASFGDKIQMKMDYRKQLMHYLDMFGRGLVVYWNGYLNDGTLRIAYHPLDRKIYITNQSFFGGRNG
jgi:hypothetical protein